MSPEKETGVCALAELFSAFSLNNDIVREDTSKPAIQLKPSHMGPQQISVDTMDIDNHESARAVTQRRDKWLEIMRCSFCRDRYSAIGCSTRLAELIRRDSTAFFVKNRNDVLKAWVLLLKAMTLPYTVTSSDSDLLAF